MAKKVWTWLVPLIVVIVILAIAIPLSMKKPAEKEVIKIGILTPLTGDAAVWGVEVKNGAEIAYDEIKNAKIDGRKIELIYEDDQCDATTGVNAIQKLINVDKVKITGGTVCSSVVLAAAKILEDNKVIHLSAGASNPAITNAGDYIFRIWPSDSFEGKKIAEFAVDDLKIKSVGILYINNEYGVGLKEAFTKAFNGKIKIAESFEPNAKDFKTQLTKIKAQDIDAIYFVANPQEAPLILKQIKEMGINKTILANGPAMEATDTLKAAGETAEGVFYAQAKQETTEEFKTKYKEKFGKDAGFASDLGYDVVKILFNAISYCKGDDTNCIKNFLYNVKDYRGASSIITFDENGDVIVPFVIKQVKEGRAIIYK